MRNRFPGYCYKCGQHVAPGYGFFEKIRANNSPVKWRIQCVKCADGRDIKPDDPVVKACEDLYRKSKHDGSN